MNDCECLTCRSVRKTVVKMSEEMKEKLKKRNLDNTIPRSKIRKIVKFVCDELRKEGGVLVFDHQHEDLEDCDEPCYFSYEPQPMIKIATKNRDSKDWIPDLLHEFSHFEQWRDDTFNWNNCFVDGVDVSVIADLWVNHLIDLSEGMREVVFNALVSLEWDAEYRTLSWLNHFNLNEYIDMGKYAQKANIYVLGYMATKKMRKWIPKIYEDRGIVSMQPRILTIPINLDLKTIKDYWPYKYEYDWNMFEPKTPTKKGFWGRLYDSLFPS